MHSIHSRNNIWNNLLKWHLKKMYRMVLHCILMYWYKCILHPTSNVRSRLIFTFQLFWDQTAALLTWCCHNIKSYSKSKLPFFFFTTLAQLLSSLHPIKTWCLHEAIRQWMLGGYCFFLSSLIHEHVWYLSAQLAALHLEAPVLSQCFLKITGL